MPFQMREVVNLLLLGNGNPLALAGIGRKSFSLFEPVFKLIGTSVKVSYEKVINNAHVPSDVIAEADNALCAVAAPQFVAATRGQRTGRESVLEGGATHKNGIALSSLAWRWLCLHWCVFKCADRSSNIWLDALVVEQVVKFIAFFLLHLLSRWPSKTELRLLLWRLYGLRSRLATKIAPGIFFASAP